MMYLEWCIIKVLCASNFEQRSSLSISHVSHHYNGEGITLMFLMTHREAAVANSVVLASCNCDLKGDNDKSSAGKVSLGSS